MDLYNINPKEFKIIDRLEYDDNVQYTLEAVEKACCCPECGSLDFIGKGINERKARDMNEYDKLVGLVIKVHRYKCKDCGNTWSDEFITVPPNAKMTKRLKDFICKRSLYVPFSDIKRDLDISVPTIKAVFHEYVEELDANHKMIAPEVLGLDETMLQGKYRGMYVDVLGGRVIDMTPDRKKATVRAWLSKLPQKERIKCVTMDMWGDYYDSVTAELPGVPIVIDKFHVYENVYRDFDDIRKELSSRLTKEERRYIKGKWRLLNHNKDNLGLSGQIELHNILESFPQFKEPHAIKEALDAIYSCDSRKDAEKELDKWIKRAEAYKLPQKDDEDNGKPSESPFSKSVTMLKNWRTQILNIYDYKYTNATTEALNRLAKEISAKGRGYSYDVLKAKIIYGTHAAKPVKFEYRTVKRKEKPNCHVREDFQVGYAMPIKSGTMQKQFVSSHSVGNYGYKKVRHIIAVPGTDIFELLDEMEMWDDPEWQEAEQITIVQPGDIL